MLDTRSIIELVAAAIISYGLIGLTMWLFRTKKEPKNPKELDSSLSFADAKPKGLNTS